MHTPTNNEHIPPLLSFEFATSTGEIKPLKFKNPIRVITAQTDEEVLKAFQLIQDAIETGYYAAGFLSYESAAAFDPNYSVKEEQTMPLLWFGIFLHRNIKHLIAQVPMNLPNGSLQLTRMNTIQRLTP